MGLLHKPWTVAEVVADLEAKVALLRDVHSHRTKAAEHNATRIARLTAANEEHQAEAAKALHVADKIAALLAD